MERARNELSDEIERITILYAQGYLSIRHFRPRTGDWVNYDMLFMGQRLTGIRRVAEVKFEADGSPSMVDTALLTGTAPGISSIFWRLNSF